VTKKVELVSVVGQNFFTFFSLQFYSLLRHKDPKSMTGPPTPGCTCKVLVQGKAQTFTARSYKSSPYSNFIVLYAVVCFIGVMSAQANAQEVWTSRTSAADIDWQSVTYGNNLFVAVSSTGTAGKSVMTSPDGITWTLRTSAADYNWVSVNSWSAPVPLLVIPSSRTAQTSPPCLWKALQI